jgi:hypothetical protein
VRWVLFFISVSSRARRLEDETSVKEASLVHEIAQHASGNNEYPRAFGWYMK